MISEFTCASGESGRCCGSIGFAGSHWLGGSGGPTNSCESGRDGESGGSCHMTHVDLVGLVGLQVSVVWWA